MGLKMARLVLVRRRREQSMLKERRLGVEVEQGGDPIAGGETNIHTGNHYVDDQEVPAETDITAVDGALDLLTEERNTLVGDIHGPDPDPGEEIARKKLRTDIVE